MSRRVALGATTASPATTTLMADTRSASQGVLEEKARGARAQARVDVLVEIECGEHEDVRGLGCGADLLDRRDAVHAWHAYVHQHDVRTQRGDLRDRLDAVAGLTHDVKAAGVLEDRAQASTDQRLVVGEQYADRHVDSPSGRRAVI